MQRIRRVADDWLRPPLREEGRGRRKRSGIMQDHLRCRAGMDGCRRDRVYNRMLQKKIHAKSTEMLARRQAAPLQLCGALQ